MHVNSNLYEDYLRFHRIQMANRDVDPVYPVLKRIGELEGWTQEERVRSVFLHVAYYDLGSCLAALDRHDGAFLRAFTDPVPGLTCGTERRRHRMGDNLRVHLADLHRIAGVYQGLANWIQSYCIHSDPAANWHVITERLMRVNGNGRWSAFKTCEMLAEVCGYPLEAPDMGHANSSGPRQGLELLMPEARALKGNSPKVIEQLDGLSDYLTVHMQEQGVQATLATAETTLCDFHSLVKGRYYPGLDIDEMQKQIDRAPLSLDMREVAWMARREELPAAYLGELNDRTGVDAARKRVYALTGEIVER
jgi:hypothetical protein